MRSETQVDGKKQTKASLGLDWTGLGWAGFLFTCCIQKAAVVGLVVVVSVVEMMGVSSFESTDRPGVLYVSDVLECTALRYRCWAIRSPIDRPLAFPPPKGPDHVGGMPDCDPDIERLTTVAKTSAPAHTPNKPNKAPSPF